MSFGEGGVDAWGRTGRRPAQPRQGATHPTPELGAQTWRYPSSSKLLAVFPQHILSVCEQKAYPGCPLPTSLREDAFTPTFPGVSPKSHHLAQYRQQEGKGVTAELQRIKLSLIKALAHRQAQRGWALLQVADSYSQRDPNQILTAEEEVPKYFQVGFSWKKRNEKHRCTHQRDCRGW